MVDLTMVMFLWGGDWLFLVRVEDIVEFTHIVPTTESSFKYFDITMKNWIFFIGVTCIEHGQEKEQEIAPKERCFEHF